MSDPSAAVREAFLARLRTALTPIKVYGEVPENREFPYVSLRTLQAIPDDTGCVDGSEIYLDFDGWSDMLDGVALGAIANAVRQALRLELEIPGHGVVVQEYLGVQFTDDPTPGIARAMFSLRLETEPVQQP
jgi:hypothetical protein